MAKKKKRRIPKRFIYIDKNDRQTIGTRNKKTGRMTGRRVLKKGEIGDRTFPVRVRGGEKGSKKYGGWILGRSPPIKVKGSKNKRGTTKTIIRKL